MSKLTAGQSLDDRYTLVRRLGGDGLAEVWLVRDDELGEELIGPGLLVLCSRAASDVALFSTTCSGSTTTCCVVFDVSLPMIDWW